MSFSEISSKIDLGTYDEDVRWSCSRFKFVLYDGLVSRYVTLCYAPYDTQTEEFLSDVCLPFKNAIVRTILYLGVFFGFTSLLTGLPMKYSFVHICCCDDVPTHNAIPHQQYYSTSKFGDKFGLLKPSQGMLKQLQTQITKFRKKKGLLPETSAPLAKPTLKPKLSLVMKKKKKPQPQPQPLAGSMATTTGSSAQVKAQPSQPSRQVMLKLLGKVTNSKDAAIFVRYVVVAVPWCI